MTKVLVLGGAILSLFVLGGCKQIEEAISTGPQATLTAYLDAQIAGDFEKAYNYLSSKDKAATPLSEYRLQGPRGELGDVIAKQMKYEIVDIVHNGNSATAEVDMTQPNFGGLAAQAIGQAFASAFGGGEGGDFENQMIQQMEQGKVPNMTTRETYTLIKGPEGWRVFLDYEGRAKVSALMEEANKLKKQRKLAAAIEKYDQALQLDSELIEAKEGIKEANEEIEKFKEKQSYLPYVVLYDLKSKYYTTYGNESIPGVEFKVKNKGDRTLNKVEVRVYFKDAKGNVVFEEDYHPVLVSEYSFGDNKPLKPNYIWQMERGKFYTAKSVPTEWKEGAISAKIANIEFAN